MILCFNGAFELLLPALAATAAAACLHIKVERNWNLQLSQFSVLYHKLQ